MSSSLVRLMGAILASWICLSVSNASAATCTAAASWTALTYQGQDIGYIAHQGYSATADNPSTVTAKWGWQVGGTGSVPLPNSHGVNGTCWTGPDVQVPNKTQIFWNAIKVFLLSNNSVVADHDSHTYYGDPFG